MLLHLKQILSADECQRARAWLGDDAAWTDGRRSAGTQAASQKHNQQLAQDSEASQPLQALVLQALQRDPLFVSAALPSRIFKPLFNRYTPQASHYGPHIDGAVLRSQTDGQWVRSDLSCTVFLSDPEEYDGGELTLHDTGGVQRIKWPAGDAVLYPSTQLHEVTPVTRGTRLASFLWVQSLVRSDAQRRILFDLDMNLLKLRQRHGECAETTALTGVYHNLLRQWATP